MDKNKDANPKKKGFFAILKESMTKTSEGCGPGCGCNADDSKDKAKSSDKSNDKG